MPAISMTMVRKVKSMRQMRSVDSRFFSGVRMLVT